MTKSLPKNWAITRIGDILDIQYGKGLPKKDRKETGSIPVYGSSGIIGKYSRALISEPCLIIGRKGAVGEIFFTNESSWPIDTVYFTVPPKEIEPKYLCYVLKMMGLHKLDSSTTIPSLRRQDLESTEIPLAPLNEQVRIVARIEELFSRLDAGVESLQAAKTRLEQYRQATLQQAYTGKLTQKWRKNNEHILIKKCLEEIDLRLDEADDGKKFNSFFDMPEKWILIRLEKLIRLSSGKFLPKKEMVLSGKFPVYGGNGLTGYHNKYLYEKEMIIIGRVGVYCGNIHISKPKSWITDNALVVESKNINLRYLAFALEMCNLNQYASSTAQPVISQKTILSIPIPIPSSEEQEKIIEKVERIKENYIHLKNEISNNIKHTINLKLSILKKAYTGGLVPQNPNDEPASVLLSELRLRKRSRRG